MELGRRVLLACAPEVIHSENLSCNGRDRGQATGWGQGLGPALSIFPRSGWNFKKPENATC